MPIGLIAHVGHDGGAHHVIPYLLLGALALGTYCYRLRRLKTARVRRSR
jgi:hypothetical protein